MIQDSTNSHELYKSQAGFLKAMEIHEVYETRITLPFETKYIETSAGKTYVRLIGSATDEPVFLWHGLGVHGGTWYHQINDLAKAYLLLVPDVIGSMGKSAPTRLERAGSAYGQWAAEVMDGLNVPLAHHVGISNGGWMILKLATADSSKIASATLISSAGFVNPDWKLLFRMLPGFVLRSGINRANHFAKVMSPPHTEPDETFVQMVNVMLNEFQYEQAPRSVTNQELSYLKSPTHLLMGEFEAAFNSHSAIKRAKVQLPNLARYELVPGVGHGMIEEDVQGVNSRIKNFLKKHPMAMKNVA